MSHVDVKTLMDALVAEGIDVADEKIVRAFRKAQNPAGCHWCGARTMIANEVVKGKKKILQLACCGREVGA